MSGRPSRSNADRKRSFKQNRKSKGNSPAPKPPRSAREVAFRVLTEHDRSGKFLSDLLPPLLDAARLDGPDRGLAHELSAGVLRRRRTLETVWTGYLKNSERAPQPELGTLLSLGVYQMLFLETPPHAAVHETVNLTKAIGKSNWTGFLNGVLRAIARDLPGRSEDETDTAPAWDRHTLPLGPQRSIRWPKPLLPDPGGEIASWFGQAFSCPDWLATRWANRFEHPDLIALGTAINEPSWITLRINPLKSDRKRMIDWFREWGAEVSRGDDPFSIRTRGLSVDHLREGLDEGLYSIQDDAATRAVRVLDPEPGMRVLDLCAGPGTKTAQMAERMGDQGVIVACDVDARRLQKVSENAARLELNSIDAHLIERDGSNVPDLEFDAILVDAPCSNTGVLGKRPEARWRIKPEDLDELPTLQLQLLETACKRLASGGRLVYSTCSIEPEENEAVIERLLSTHPDLIAGPHSLTLPTLDHDGAFVALVTKA